MKKEIDDVAPSLSQLDKEKFYSDLEKAGLGAFWEVIPSVKKKKEIPRIWRWDEVYPLLMKAGEIVQPGEGAERRVLLCSHPENKASSTPSLTASVQLVQPGEVASSHRHTMTAIRFILSGNGAFTDVEGERIFVEEYDLVVTPSWTWHDHGNETNKPVIWLDGLDAPIVRSLQADFFEQDEEKQQEISKIRDYTRKKVGDHWLRPTQSSLNGTVLPMVYRWKEVYPTLLSQLEEEEDPFDGVILEYINPISGEPTTTTLGCYIQLLRPGISTQTHRHMGSTVYQVVKGSGYTTIDGEKQEWKEGDIWTLPSWSWHSHVNGSMDEVILFSYTEAPVLKQLGLYRYEQLDNEK